MKRVVSGIVATYLIAGVLGDAIPGANAAPLSFVTPGPASSSVQQVQLRRDDDRDRFECRRMKRPRQECRVVRRPFERRGD